MTVIFAIMETTDNIEKIKCEFCDAYIKNAPRSIGSHIGYWHRDKCQELFHVKPEFSMKCLECGDLVANTENVLARHIRKFHQIEWIDYLVKHEFGGIWPICKCGCGEKLEWCKGGFPRFVFGHGQRGENNAMFGKLGSDNPNTGKVRTDEMKEKYSKAAKTRWADPNDKRYETFKT